MNRSFNMMSLTLIGTLFFSNVVIAKSMSREQIVSIAKSIASEANKKENVKKVLGDGIVDFYSEAIGVNVMSHYTTKLDFRLTRTELIEFSDKARKLVLPKICNTNRNNPAFDQGLFYTLVYESTQGQTLAEFKVDKLACSAY